MSIADIFGTEGDGTALRELRPQKQGHRRHHRLVAPPIVERWIESEIAAHEVADPRFIGAEEGDRWAGVTGGSNGVGDLRNLEPTVGFHWDPAWLIAVRDAESGERVLIDGDERANELQLGRRYKCNCAKGEGLPHHRRSQLLGRPGREGCVVAAAVTGARCRAKKVP